MSDAMFRISGGAAAAIMIRTAVVYFFLLVGFRLAGKRQMGQMTVFDLVVILIVANAVQNAMVGQDSSLIGGLIAAATLLLLNWGVSWVRHRSKVVSRWVGGTRTLLIEDGRFLPEHLEKENLEKDEVLMAMREHGLEDLRQVHQAFLETDGSISVIPKEEAHIKARRHVRFLKKG